MTVNTTNKLALHLEAWRERNRKSSWTAMFKEAGLSAGTAIPIREGRANYLPSLETLDKLAEYMNEDRQYLRELAGYASYNGTEEQLASDERALIDGYRKLEQRHRSMVWDMVQNLLAP